MENDEKIIEFTQKLKDAFLSRIAFYVNIGKIEDAFKDLNSMKSTVGLEKNVIFHFFTIFIGKSRQN